MSLQFRHSKKPSSKSWTAAGRKHFRCLYVSKLPTAGNQTSLGYKIPVEKHNGYLGRDHASAQRAQLSRKDGIYTKRRPYVPKYLTVYKLRSKQNFEYCKCM